MQTLNIETRIKERKPLETERDIMARYQNAMDNLKKEMPYSKRVMKKGEKKTEEEKANDRVRREKEEELWKVFIKEHETLERLKADQGIYRCMYCGKEFETTSQIKNILRERGLKPGWCSRKCVKETYTKETGILKNDIEEQCRELRHLGETFYNYNSECSGVLLRHFSLYDPETGLDINIRDLVLRVSGLEQKGSCRYGNQDCLNPKHFKAYTSYMEVMDALPQEAKKHFKRRYLFDANEELSKAIINNTKEIIDELLEGIKVAEDYSAYCFDKPGKSLLLKAHEGLVKIEF
jgi:DNA-directed RNA polymerase subunit RPC12/RpoP